MARGRNDSFTSIRLEGSLLSPDLFNRMRTSPEEIEGLRPDDYHLAGNERLNEAINRSWNRTCSLWQAFREAREKLSANDLGTGMTRERWLLPLFQELGYGRLVPMKAQEIGGKSYPISHFWQHSPIHLLGFHLPLDRRTSGAAGATTMSPQSMVQEFLNRSEHNLWGLLSNGFTLRLLRDNASIASQAFIEFDLETMMEGELYSDFVLFWLLCHQSRFEADNPADCWLERWCLSTQQEGSRILDRLRDGVLETINLIGQGFLAHPANQSLRQALQLGELDKQDYYRHLLRLVYRIIFLCTAEDRGLLFSPNVPIIAQQRYNNYYSLRRLRELAEKRRGTQHCDLYQQLKLVMKGLGHAEGLKILGLPALGSFLWSDTAMPHLMNSELSNWSLLSALRALTLHQQGTRRIRVDFHHLGAEELGSVYESLLELHPQLHVESRQFILQEAAGNERKTTGSYYTRTELINCLLDSALDPVLEETAKQADPEQAILNLKVCDPACGSGQFLVGAARRIAYRLATVRTGEEEPPQSAYRQALRQVVSRCIYGVDINEMAAELCKINLWLESLEPGMPLNFLDHHIQCGNSLLGATPGLLAQGIPDEAFEAIEGDYRKIVSALKRQNCLEKTGHNSLFDSSINLDNSALSSKYKIIDDITENLLQDQEEKERRYEDYLASFDYLHLKLLSDAWCASFVWIKDSNRMKYSLTHSKLELLRQDPSRVEPEVIEEITRLASQYKYFHWHLAFPTVFCATGITSYEYNNQTGWQGGFDVVLGNPPWGRMKLQEKEWFASRVPEIAQAPTAAARHRLIDELQQTHPELLTAFLETRRQAEGESHLVRHSNLFPLCGRGDINTYAVFAELMKNLINSFGRVGCIIPSGIATDDTTKYFFQEIVNDNILVSLYDFENKDLYFPGVHNEQRFCLLTLTGQLRPQKIGGEFIFYARNVQEIKEINRRFTLSTDEIYKLNPNTLNCPTFRSRRDSELCKNIYNNSSILIKDGLDGDNPWRISFLRMFDMTNDSGLFRKVYALSEQEVGIDTGFRHDDRSYVPILEGKLTQIYDHRAATFKDVALDEVDKGNPRDTTDSEHCSPYYTIMCRNWISIKDYNNRISTGLPSSWLAFHGIVNPNNERTFIATICPAWPTSNSLPIMQANNGNLLPDGQLLLLANLNAFVFDFVARLKIASRNANFFIVKQLPIIKPLKYNNIPKKFIIDRSFELTYTAWDLFPFACEFGYNGPPFRWEEERRFLIRCEIDAAYFHLYGIEREDVDYIMETFPIVKRKDEATYGSYRTKETIMAIFDQMKESIQSGQSYQTILDPPPGPPEEWPVPSGEPWPEHIHNP